jgi:NAD(P)-dependent dehydrogenase (short-subunit alcohol dehydrogenase family)
MMSSALIDPSTRLRDKTVLITGAASGIGRGTARVFAAQGARLVVTDVNGAALKTLADELGDSVVAWQEADVSDEAAVARLFEDAVAPLGRLDGVVCSHGILDLEDGLLENHATGVFERTLRVNLFGDYFVVRGAIPWLKEAGRGSIVLISSLASLRTPSSIAYGASKGAINAMAKTISGQYARHGIRCNVVCPGSIETPMFQRASAKHAGGTATTPSRDLATMGHMGRIGQPEDIGYAAAFLVSDESGFITATVQVVDGGVGQH